MSSMKEHLERVQIRDNAIQTGFEVFKTELLEDEITHIEDQFIHIFSDIEKMAEKSQGRQEDAAEMVNYLFNIILSVMTYNSILVSKLEGIREKD
jgi:hypothetical protein